MTTPTMLEGVRVLDLSRVLAGPWSAQILADYGADVIKVERPGLGDDTRAWGPPWWGDPKDRMSAYYLSANRGKRSIAIDIATPEGAALVRQLALEADVLVENYKVASSSSTGWTAPRCRPPTPSWCIARSPATGRPDRTRPMQVMTSPSRPPAA